MILSKLTKFAWAFFVLALTAGTLSAQRGNSRNAALNSQSNNCLNQISGLSTEQAEKIRELNNVHNMEMAQLRVDRRSKTDTNSKDQIRAEMLDKVDDHRSEVRSLLNANQQKEYDSVQRSGNQNGQQSNRVANGNNNNCRFQQGARRSGNGQRGNFNDNGRNR